MTLAKTIEIGRQFENSQSQLKMIRGEQVFGIKSASRSNFRKKTPQPHKRYEIVQKTAKGRIPVQMWKVREDPRERQMSR